MSYTFWTKTNGSKPSQMDKSFTQTTNAYMRKNSIRFVEVNTGRNGKKDIVAARSQ